MTRPHTRTAGTPARSGPPRPDADRGGTGAVQRLAGVLLAGLIDDAALFPPARKPLEEALADHRRFARGPHAALMGAFLTPASLLTRLVAALPPDDHPWLGVIVDGPLSLPPGRGVAMVELRGQVTGAVATLDRAGVPPQLPAYVELPVDPDPARSLDRIAAHRQTGRALGAKVRCGGETPAAVPTVPQLAAFIAGCAERGVPMKATAGLHRAVRHTDPATGQRQHGFLNLVLACAAAIEGGDIEAVLAETEGDALLLAEVSPDTAARARAELLASYGSCSLAEPAAELDRWGLRL